ncbi:MAG: AraC family transcriptional regulator [Bacteroidota bacterium]
MITSKPALEKVTPAFGASFNYQHYDGPTQNTQPIWHFHPELELVYVNGGNGKRHIGNHISYFNDGDLIFIGSNLPHFGFTDRLTANRKQTVVQMQEGFLGSGFFNIPEMASVQQLLERSKQGLAFHGRTKYELGRRLEELATLDNYDRLLSFLSILKEMALSEEYEILNVQAITLEVQPKDTDRINQVFSYVQENFKEPIPLEDIADEVSMTVPAFCRYFKKHSNKTFTRFVNEHRVVHACKLLSETSLPITEVCYESGFNNFSNFNKIFKETTGKNPSAYRAEVKKVVKGDGND